LSYSYISNSIFLHILDDLLRASISVASARLLFVVTYGNVRNVTINVYGTSGCVRNHCLREVHSDYYLAVQFCVRCGETDSSIQLCSASKMAQANL
jgi:hypothetical protein